MRALSDDRSTAVGYGPICADHFGLPWGEAAPAQGPGFMELAGAGIERDLGNARGTAQSRARRANREFAARTYA